MTRPVCWSKSWRLTPRMKMRSPLNRRSTPRISTRRNPMRSTCRSISVPSAERSVTWRSRSAGVSAVQRGTSGISRSQWTRPGRGGACRRNSASQAAWSAGSPTTAAGPPTMWRWTISGNGHAGGPGGSLVARTAGSRPAISASTTHPALGATPANPMSTVRSSVPVVRSSARPPIAAMSATYTGPVAYRYTERVIPPCHHWSWSSTYVESDHFTTVRRRWFVCGWTWSLMSNSAARWASLLMPTSRPLTWTRRTLSAAPTCRTMRRPTQSSGSSKVRS